MDWEIHSFKGVGPLKFGMLPQEVASILGDPVSIRKGIRANTSSETRDGNMPILKYKYSFLSEIEFFYDSDNVRYKDLNIFKDNGNIVMERLETYNGGALAYVGIVVFQNIGISAGRLDELVKSEHSITAFASGIWDDKLSTLSSITFSGKT